MKTILIVEDEKAISAVLKAYLLKAGFQVVQAFDGNEAIKKFDENQPSLVLLDVMLPGKGGWEILKYIREKTTCPVIMLTALDQINFKLEGLNGGADDYLTKPFIGEEVVARVNAVLRRVEPFPKKDATIFGQLTIDYKAHAVFLGGLELDFTPRDLSLFIFLSKHPDQIFTREQLIDQVWGMDYDGSDRAVDLSIKRIRNVLKNWSEQEGEIKTLRGMGYKFCVYTK